MANALASAAGWLIEQAELAEGERSPVAPTARPVVAVVGISPRCGATIIARALGCELAARDPAGACAVTWSGQAGLVALGVPAASRLTRTLSLQAAVRVRACGRLCLIETHDAGRLADAARYLGPLVLDVEDPAQAPRAAALADHLLLVGSPATEPALAAVMAGSLRRLGPEPVAVLNRPGREPGRWHGRAAFEVPESRLGAQLALTGREPHGRLGRAIAELADRCEGRR